MSVLHYKLTLAMQGEFVDLVSSRGKILRNHAFPHLAGQAWLCIFHAVPLGAGRHGFSCPLLTGQQTHAVPAE